MILRRVQLADGRTRAFINDPSISVQTLKAVGAALARSTSSTTSARWSDASTHRQLLDAFAGLEKEVAALETLWEARRTANQALDEHRASMERAAREADYLRHAADATSSKARWQQRGKETRRADRRVLRTRGTHPADRARMNANGRPRRSARHGGCRRSRRLASVPVALGRLRSARRLERRTVRALTS
jgi:DNA repair protein RecN (Recombination protein N)